jgi:hypothetical protein
MVKDGTLESEVVRAKVQWDLYLFHDTELLPASGALLIGVPLAVLFLAYTSLGATLTFTGGSLPFSIR